MLGTATLDTPPNAPAAGSPPPAPVAIAAAAATPATTPVVTPAATQAAASTTPATTATPAAAATAETKPGDKPATQPVSLMATEAKADVPPEVKDDLKIPEKAPLTDADVAAVTEFAKANKMSAEMAQHVLEDRAKLVAGMQTKVATEQKASFDKLWTDWQTETKSDKDYGGDKLPESQKAVKRFISRYADPDFAEALAKSPFGNHRGFFRMLARAGLAMAEDSSAGVSNAPGGAAKQISAIDFFPSMRPK